MGTKVTEPVFSILARVCKFGMYALVAWTRCPPPPTHSEINDRMFCEAEMYSFGGTDTVV